MNSKRRGEPEASFKVDDFMPSEKKCFEELRKIRWKNGVRRPRCGSENVREYIEARKPCCRRYWCRDCERTFNDLTGTILADTNIDPREWVYVMDKLSGNMPMNEISEKLGRGYNTVMRIRDLVARALAKELFEEFEDKVEIDETYVPAGRKGSKTEDRSPRERGLKLRGRGTYQKDEPPIIGAVQRRGKVVLREARKLGNKFVRALLGDHVKEESKVYHDDFSIYNYLPGYDDVTLDQSEGKYVDGEAHTNTIEVVLSPLKSRFRNFQGVRKDNLWKYLKIFKFDFNLRELDPFQKLTCLFASMIL